MNIKHTRLWLLAAVAPFPMLSGGVISFSFENLSVPEASILTSMGDPLASGSLVELGYFEGSLFASDWVSLTGADGLMPGINLAIGQSPAGVVPPAGDGRFFFEFDLETDDHPGFPMEGTQLALRFYSGPDRASAFAFNTVAGDSWLVPAMGSDPFDPFGGSGGELFVSLGGMGLTWEGTPYEVAIPEPSVYAALFGLGALVWVARRRRAQCATA